MRAAVFTETGGPLSIENIEPAPPGPRDVIVQLGASGVCHSDLSLKNGYVGIMPGTVLGHEGAGTIVEVGKDVIGLATGRPHRRVVHPRVRRLLLLPARPVAPVRHRVRGHDAQRGASAPTAPTTRP